jgi:hypothetical protein
MDCSPIARTVAMPLVACGNQNVPVAEMVTPLVDAAVNWMSRDFPLQRLIIVEYSGSRSEKLKTEFAEVKERYAFSQPNLANDRRFDVFVSYSRADAAQSKTVVSELRRLSQGIRIFFDQMVIKPGHAWQQEIYEAIENCRHFIALYSPDYLKSKVCLEEFHLAKFCSREIGTAVIFPIYLFSTELPAYMRIIEYADCREGDAERLRLACGEFLTQLR